MKDPRIAAVETSTGWSLELFELVAAPGVYRVELSTPEGRAVLVKSGCKTLDEAFEVVRNYFEGQKLRHTATVLVEMCRAELR